jgi:hypothetical protein
MSIPSVNKLLIWGDENSSNALFVQNAWHEVARTLFINEDTAYQTFEGIKTSNAKKADQFAAALGWFGVDRYEKRFGVTADTQTLKNHQLRYIGLADGTDLSFLRADPGIQASGILGE